MLREGLLSSPYSLSLGLLLVACQISQAVPPCSERSQCGAWGWHGRRGRHHEGEQSLVPNGLRLRGGRISVEGYTPAPLHMTKEWLEATTFGEDPLPSPFLVCVQLVQPCGPLKLVFD